MPRLTFFCLGLIIGISLCQAVVLPRAARNYTPDFVFPSSDEQDKPSPWQLPLFEHYKHVNDKHNKQTSYESSHNSLSEQRSDFVQQAGNCAGTAATEARLLVVREPTAVIDNAVEYVRKILTDDLDLWHLAFHILQAKLVESNQILFEMATKFEAQAVLEAYCNHVQQAGRCQGTTTLPYQIVSTDRNFLEHAVLDVRKLD